MKKKYTRPVLTAVCINAETIMAASGPGIYDGTVDNNSSLSKRHGYTEEELFYIEEDEF